MDRATSRHVRATSTDTGIGTRHVTDVTDRLASWGIDQEEAETMGTEATRTPKHPPPWFVHTAWRVHRALYKLSGGRFLWTTSNKRGWGALRLATTGRKSGQERSVIIGYLEDGPNLVAMAMNGWDEGNPSWWLNLEAHPDAVVRLPHQQPRRCAHTLRWGRSVIGCGSAGSRLIRGSTRMRSGGRPRRRSSSSNRGARPLDGPASRSRDHRDDEHCQDRCGQHKRRPRRDQQRESAGEGDHGVMTVTDTRCWRSRRRRLRCLLLRRGQPQLTHTSTW